jgi:catechol 2,3-dioxygenase-like lactoylglutathione lyase family enzyme
MDYEVKMLARNKIKGFVPTKDLKRAKPFYLDVLGLKFESEDQFALEVWGGENRIRIVPVETFDPMPITILGWDVPDIEFVATGLRERGVTFETYSFLKQNALGIWDSPQGTRVAWFKDPDGNVLAISQYPIK